MTKDKIKFGTDGWRGVISREFTFENLRLVAQATVDYMKKEGLHKKGLIVGYDRRFLSKEYAREVACVAAANGLKVHLGQDYAPTPAVSWAVKEMGAGGGVMITASHNPPKYNGFKFKESFGGSALPETTKKLEELALQGRRSGKSPLFVPFEEGLKNGLISPLIEPIKTSSEFGKPISANACSK